MSDTLIEVIEYRGHNIEVHRDDDPINPIKDYDTIGKFVCFHNRYNLGNCDEFDSPEEFVEYCEDTKVLALPLYLYDHSGITMNTTGFGCPWDSGQVGWIYVTYKKVFSEYGGKYMTKKLRTRIEGYLRNEVREYDHYLTGYVHGYIVPVVDESCWGFFGDTKYMIEDAQAHIDYYIKEGRKSHYRTLAEWIRNKVALHYRKPLPEECLG